MRNLYNDNFKEEKLEETDGNEKSFHACRYNTSLVSKWPSYLNYYVDSIQSLYKFKHSSRTYSSQL